MDRTEPTQEPIQAICLAGATGSGKSSLALRLAAEAPCEIINADSRQLYADFPIISAQPSQKDREMVTHELYGFLPGEKKCNAMNWAKMAADKARKAWNNGRIPVIVGGTGFYFEALLKGLSPMPAISPQTGLGILHRMEEQGPAALYEELRRIDPEYAALIRPQDRQRICRALEVYEASGRNFSWWRSKPVKRPSVSGPLFVLKSQLADLVPGLLERIDLMLEMGALEEVAKALEKCPDKSAPGWSCIGANECLSFLAGNISETELRESWLAATRAYAKRQLTWFRGRRYAIAVEPEAFVAHALDYLSRHNPDFSC